jgi:hypothetical protein
VKENVPAPAPALFPFPAFSRSGVRNSFPGPGVHKGSQAEFASRGPSIRVETLSATVAECFEPTKHNNHKLKRVEIVVIY